MLVGKRLQLLDHVSPAIVILLDHELVQLWVVCDVTLLDELVSYGFVMQCLRSAD